VAVWKYAVRLRSHCFPLFQVTYWSRFSDWFRYLTRQVGGLSHGVILLDGAW